MDQLPLQSVSRLNPFHKVDQVRFYQDKSVLNRLEMDNKTLLVYGSSSDS